MSKLISTEFLKVHRINNGHHRTKTRTAVIDYEFGNKEFTFNEQIKNPTDILHGFMADGGIPHFKLSQEKCRNSKWHQGLSGSV